MVIATAMGWGNAASIGISIVLAFFFGYSLTLGPVLRAGVPPQRALPLAFASDTASITVMEITDNAFILLVPGAIAAGLGQALFWWSLGVSLLIAFVFALPLNRWLIARGRGHAEIHAYHGTRRVCTHRRRVRTPPCAGSARCSSRPRRCCRLPASPAVRPVWPRSR